RGESPAFSAAGDAPESTRPAQSETRVDKSAQPEMEMREVFQGDRFSGALGRSSGTSDISRAGAIRNDQDQGQVGRVGVGSSPRAGGTARQTKTIALRARRPMGGRSKSARVRNVNGHPTN